MATLDFRILEAAYQDNLIGQRLTERQKLYLVPSVQTANEILEIIRQCAQRGAGIEGLSLGTSLHPNTVKMYCRWLRSKGFLEWEEEGQGGAIVYYLSGAVS